ncbi:sensor histidine kinase [Comamonas odontotermitis]|uniref:sensor histidine kinase n=1 Tax=Comamonas odontotermitis TaxID=379895 RepID=UPI001CC40ABB|nr:HAMP domain-containing sensor histidine kinase [Comamonas odontotermitis]UBB15737.1 HAMP domain-containing histidine kinase [Comamonas odontotermitis]
MTTINYNLFFATSAFVSGLVLIPLLLSNHIRQIGINRIGLYTLGFFIATLAVCLYAGWFNNNPTIYSYSSIGNHLLTLGVAVQTLGIRKFYSQPLMRYLIIPCTVISEVLVFWFMWGNPNYPYRLMSFTSFLFVFVFIQFITVIRYGDKSFINRLLSTSLAIECLVYLIRFTTLFIPDLVPTGPTGSSYIQIAYVFVFSAVMPITAICLMINGNYLLQQKSLADAKVKNQQKTETLGFISHDLRAPLATISGYAELLLNDATDAQRKALISIQDNIKYQLSLIDELQDYSTLELYPLALKPTTTELLPLLNDISGYALALCSKQNNCFRCQLPQRIPRLMYLDGNRLRQVLLNLLSNAAKFTRNGAINLSVTLESEEKGYSLHFAVSDTGVGIDLNSNIDIFGAFQQVQATSGSTGLGLFIAQRILSAMGSTLHVTSTVGQGSTFSFALSVPEFSDADSNWSIVPPSMACHGEPPQDLDLPGQALPEKAALDELANLALHGRLTDIESWIEFHCQRSSHAPFTALLKEMLERFDFSGIHTLALRSKERAMDSHSALPIEGLGAFSATTTG